MDDNITLISLLTGTKNDSNVNSLFGTDTNPVKGKFYNITDENIETVVEQNIADDVMEIIQKPITDIKLVDYFPEDIIDNFEFSYVGSPSVGTASDTIDSNTKTITWNIGTLKGDEEAILKYKLKIKDMKNTELLNKTLATNEKVLLTYKDAADKDYTVELTSSPKIQLSEVKEELIATVSYNPTADTTGSVLATITTNKKVNNVEGWTLSDDGKTLTKTYSSNSTETVHLVDFEGMEKDVSIAVTNIIQETQNTPDNTTAPQILPNTGFNKTILIIGISSIIIIAIVLHKKLNNYKDVK